MKKMLYATWQVIAYCIIYEITVWVVYLIAELIKSLVCAFPIILILLTENVLETITYTFAPALSAFIIVLLMGVLFGKSKLNTISAIIIFMILSYTNLTLVIQVANQYGIITWEFANVIWQTVILCGIIIVGLFQLTSFAEVKNLDTK